MTDTQTARTREETENEHIEQQLDVLRKMGGGKLTDPWSEVDEDCRFTAAAELVEALDEIGLETISCFSPYSEFDRYKQDRRVPLDLLRGDHDDKMLLALHVIQGYLRHLAAGQLAVIEALHRIAPPPPNPNLEDPTAPTPETSQN